MTISIMTSFKGHKWEDSSTQATQATTVKLVILLLLLLVGMVMVWQFRFGG